MSQREFNDWLEDGHPHGIPQNKLKEVIECGDARWNPHNNQTGWRLDRKKVIPAKGSSPIYHIYAIQPNKEQEGSSKKKNIARAAMSSNSGMGSNSTAVVAQIQTPAKINITIQQVKDAFRASIVPGYDQNNRPNWGKVYEVIVDENGNYTVDTTKITPAPLGQKKGKKGN